jgi:NAD(P)-dependent dehydrogenase (short-subunit alcohol dehydrogenase family)
VERIDDKVVLVEGAARGIGAASARLLAAEDAHVMLSDVCETQLAEFGDEPRRDGATAQTLRLDARRGIVGPLSHAYVVRSRKAQRLAADTRACEAIQTTPTTKRVERLS